MPVTLAARFMVRYEVIDGDESEPWQVETPDGHEASFESEAEARAFADDCNAEYAKELKAAEESEREELVAALQAHIEDMGLTRLRSLAKRWGIPVE